MKHTNLSTRLQLASQHVIFQHSYLDHVYAVLILKQVAWLLLVSETTLAVMQAVSLP